MTEWSKYSFASTNAHCRGMYWIIKFWITTQHWEWVQPNTSREKLAHVYDWNVRANIKFVWIFYNYTLESPICQNFDLKPDSPFNDCFRIKNFSILLSWNCFRWLHIFRWLVRQSKIQAFGQLTLVLTILTYKENEAGDEESNPNASYQWNVLREKLVFDCWKYA